MEELLMCSVCIERYQEEERHPVLLPRCGHSFCRPCITMLASAGCVVCPTCRMDQRVDSIERLPTEFTLLAIIHAQENSKKETCSEHGVKLSFWCKTCCVPACGECLFEDHPTHTHDVIKASMYINRTKETAREVATKFIDCLDDRERIFYKCIFNSVKKISIALREVSVLRKDFEEARDLIKTINEEVSISSASSLGETAKFLALKWNIRGESYDTEKQRSKAKRDNGESCIKNIPKERKPSDSKSADGQSKAKVEGGRDEMEPLPNQVLENAQMELTIITECEKKGQLGSKNKGKIQENKSNGTIENNKIAKEKIINNIEKKERRDMDEGNNDKKKETKETLQTTSPQIQGRKVEIQQGKMVDKNLLKKESESKEEHKQNKYKDKNNESKEQESKAKEIPTENEKITKELSKESQIISKEKPKENENLAKEIPSENKNIAKEIQKETEIIAKEIPKENANIDKEIPKENESFAKTKAKEHKNIVKEIPKEKEDIANEIKENENIAEEIPKEIESQESRKENKVNLCIEKREKEEQVATGKCKFEGNHSKEEVKDAGPKGEKEESKEHGNNIICSTNEEVKSETALKKGNTSQNKESKEGTNSNPIKIKNREKESQKNIHKDKDKEEIKENKKQEVNSKQIEIERGNSDKDRNLCDEKSHLKRDVTLIPNDPKGEKMSESKGPSDERAKISKTNKDDKKDKSIPRLKRWKIKSPQREEKTIETSPNAEVCQTANFYLTNISSATNAENQKNPLKDAEEAVRFPLPLPGSEGQKIHGMPRAQREDQPTKQTSPESTELDPLKDFDQMPSLQTQVNKDQEEEMDKDKIEDKEKIHVVGDQEIKERIHEEKKGCEGKREDKCNEGGCENNEENEPTQDPPEESALIGANIGEEEFPKSETKLMDCIQVPGFMLGVEAQDGRMATLSWSPQGLHVHSMQLHQFEYDILVKLSLLNSMIPSKSPTVFLELSSEQTILGRIYITLWGHLRRSQNFMTLCMGERGPSYANTKFLQVYNVDSPGERILGGDYEYNNGKGGKGLIDDLESSGVYSLPMEAGMVTAAGSGQETTNSLFLICTKSDPARSFSCPFGMVCEGLKLISEAVQMSERQEPTYISDCGVVIVPPVET